jgi:hypothetical protein
LVFIVFPVKLLVVQRAKPHHVKRGRVIGVVRLRLETADPTRLRLDLAVAHRIADRDVSGPAPRVRLPPLRPNSDVFGSAVR